MTIKLYKLECPYCRSTWQFYPVRDYKDGETKRSNCPICMGEVVVLCEYQPMFVAYQAENWKEDDDE